MSEQAPTRPPSDKHESEHELRMRIDERGAWVTSCTCGVELSYTRVAPHHCIGLWRRHVIADSKRELDDEETRTDGR